MSPRSGAHKELNPPGRAYCGKRAAWDPTRDASPETDDGKGFGRKRKFGDLRSRSEVTTAVTFLRPGQRRNTGEPIGGTLLRELEQVLILHASREDLVTMRTIRTINGVFAPVVDGMPLIRPRPPAGTARIARTHGADHALYRRDRRLRRRVRTTVLRAGAGTSIRTSSTRPAITSRPNGVSVSVWY